MRARGAGGQHVNRTESAVRVTHIPSGISAMCQDSRSQHNNKESAMEVLYARVYSIEKQKQVQASMEAKKLQVGSGDRSEKIRTYNFPQNRVTDHRTNLTVHGMEEMLKGNLLQKFIDEAEALQRQKLIEELMKTSK